MSVKTSDVESSEPRYSGGRTNTGFALGYALDHGFEYARTDAMKLVLVITDGKSDDDVVPTAEV